MHAVILAAGESNRMESRYPKLLLPFRQRPILWWSLDAALKSMLSSVSLVVGADHKKVLYSIKDVKGGSKLRIVINERWQEGRSTSVQAGIESMPETATHTMFLLGDMPLMTRQLINRMITLAEKSQELPILFPLWQGEKAHPVIFSRKCLAELVAVEGDESGLEIAHKYIEQAATFDLLSDTTQFNVNTSADYRTLIEKYEKE